MPGSIKHIGREIRYAGGFQTYPIVAKVNSYTILAEDGGTLFTNLGAAGAVTFTLPALSEVVDGWSCEFQVAADQNFIVAAAAADVDRMVVFNDAAADSIAFQTAAERIGGGLLAIADVTNSKWYVRVFLGAETQTPTIVT